jgi:hypothetical protein
LNETARRILLLFLLLAGSDLFAAELEPQYTTTAKGKLLTQELINDIFQKFRSIPKW